MMESDVLRRRLEALNYKTQAEDALTHPGKFCRLFSVNYGIYDIFTMVISGGYFLLVLHDRFH